MAESILFLVYYSLVLVFGVFLSAAFSGIRVHIRRNLFILLAFSAFCGILQGATLFYLGEEMVWKLYPVITHLPLLIFLCLFYRKKLLTVLAAVCAAYLCCQPAKWVGVLAFAVFKNNIVHEITRSSALLIFAFIVLRYMSSSLAEVFQKDAKSICIFGSLPFVYYVFDYLTVIYTDLWLENNRAALEFLPFILCIMFLIFCVAYYREYEEKSAAERSEQVIRLCTEQQAREMDTLKRSAHEVRLLRHDMRHLLNAVAVCIENDEKEQANELISSYVQKIDRTKQTRFCESDVINYVLSDFLAKCELFSVDFSYTVEAAKIETDELIFSSILSNALDNALNAQKKLLGDERHIRLMIKNVDGKLLLSVKNPVGKTPAFSDGLPVAEKIGHGYGTKSILYMTKRLGGNCQFSVKDGWFILRVII